MNMDFSKWLKGKFLNWQVEQGESRTQAQFAAYLGIPATSFSNWVNTGSKPRSEYIGVLASKLGPEIYDILGMGRPAQEEYKDPSLLKWIKLFIDSSPEERENLLANAEHLADPAKRRV